MFAKFDFTKIAAITFALFVFFWLFSSVSYRSVADDQYFINSLANQDVISFIKDRYLTWSGRWAIEAITALTISHIYVVKVLIPTCLILASFFMSRICFVNADVRHLSITLAFIILMPSDIFTDSVTWITGFYNYLLPTTFGLFFFYVFINNLSRKINILSILALFIACNHEQVALACLMGSALFLAIKRERVTPYRCLALALIIINSLILIMAPGNYIRQSQESILRMPEYFDLTMLNKISMGYDRLNSMFFMRSNFLIIALSFLILYFLIAKWKTRASNLVSFSILAFVITCLVFFNYNGVSSPLLGSTIEYKHFDPFIVLPSYMLLSSLLITFLYVISQSVEKFEWIALSILVAVANVIAIGFSPTVYASGMRVLFVSEIILTLSCIMLISKTRLAHEKLNEMTIGCIASSYIFITCT